MIKVVPDTNVIIKGMLGYTSECRQILNLALSKDLVLYGSEETFAEFCKKIKMDKFAKYWKTKLFSPEKVIMDYKTIINIVKPTEEAQKLIIPIRDSDDAIFFKIAKSCGASIVVSADIKHVIEVKEFDGIKAITAERFMEVYKKVG